MRLLVVEDDFALSEVLVYSLRQVGYAVDRVDDGIAADTILRHERFDLIVLDLSLPKLDGPGLASPGKIARTRVTPHGGPR